MIGEEGEDDGGRNEREPDGGDSGTGISRIRQVVLPRRRWDRMGRGHCDACFTLTPSIEGYGAGNPPTLSLMERGPLVTTITVHAGASVFTTPLSYSSLTCPGV